jgi:hypothetical protein
MSTGAVVVAGAVAQRPGYGGHTWVFLQYLLGFRRLGLDVLFVDQLTADMCVDGDGRPCPPGTSANLRYVQRVMSAFGFDDDYAVLLDDGASFGCSRGEVEQRLRDADLLLNVMGYLDDIELLALARRRVYLDIDPGFGHMWAALGLADPFAGHDAYVTVGENVGAPDCAIPTGGLNWSVTAQPIVLEHWSVADGPGRAVTSVGSWRGPYGPVEHAGHVYGLRVHEFRKFFALPRLTGAPLEMALDIDAAEGPDLRGLEEGGWSLVDPAVVAGDPWSYREYVNASKGELCVAKGMYVDTNSGWFSDRSICYLAGGRPVLAQETGFSRYHPTGEGLLAFRNLDEAVAGLETFRSDPERHRRAARAIAEEHFDSDRVLPRLLDEVAA